MRLVSIALALTVAAWVMTGTSRADAVKSWSAVPSDRYESLSGFNDEAFLDKDTGLVWRKYIEADQEISSGAASNYCATRFVGGKGGWRLPKFEEIHSLLEFNGTNVFTNAPFDNYSCDNFYYSGGGWINTCNGTFTPPSTENDIMCVRGGTN